MDYPKDLKYSKDHEWVQISGEIATIGVTKYALDQLGDIVHLDLPAVGEEFDSMAPFGTIESTKTVSDLYAPVSGKVLEVNEDVMDNIEGLVEDCYDEGWLIKVQTSDLSELDDLMDNKEYEEYLSEQEED